MSDQSSNLGSLHDTAWKVIEHDPALARARRALSIHEFRIVIDRITTAMRQSVTLSGYSSAPETKARRCHCGKFAMQPGIALITDEHAHDHVFDGSECDCEDCDDCREGSESEPVQLVVNAAGTAAYPVAQIIEVNEDGSPVETSAVRAGVSVKDPTPPQEIVLCAAMGPSGFICERPKGHAGRHRDGDNTSWDAEKALAKSNCGAAECVCNKHASWCAVNGKGD